MADLKPLIRVRKHAIDQKQKFLAELYRQSEELENHKTALENQLAEEREKIQELGPEMLVFFGAYAEGVKTRIEEIIEDKSRLETRIQIAQDDMKEAFSELKKIEIIQDRRELENKQEEDRRDSTLMDEIGITSYLRQSDEQ